MTDPLFPSVDPTSRRVRAKHLPDATTTTKGVVQLAGDLGGTATAPTVPGLAGKANSTHTHTAATISDLTEVVQDLVAALFGAGTHTGITFTYNDAGQAISAAVTAAPGGSVDAETVRDIVGATIRGTAPITATSSDAGDTTTLAVTIGTAANTVAAGNDIGFTGYRAVTTRSGSFTLAAADFGALHLVTSAGTVTAPSPTSLGLAVGQVAHFMPTTAGAVTLAAGSGATLSNRYSSYVSSGQWATVELVAISASGYVVRGETA